MTLIVLLILATVSLSSVFSEKGIFSRAEKAGNRYNETKAREVLETVLLTDGQYEKHSNTKYNQDDFLDDLIEKEITGSEVKGDVAIIGGEYAYELDRSVPKIGRYLGLAKDLVWPKVEITSEPTLINNGREAKFTAKATEITKGITRIELWLNGKRIEKETITYETPQTEITKEFTVNKNGKYTIKAYAGLMGSEKTTVEGIVPAVSFSPNGSKEWKKEHTTQIIVEETAETIAEMKYVWVKDNGENEPEDILFTTDCLNNRTVTGGNDEMTGEYYLWVMLKTGTGENIRINKYPSNAFNFDNEGPKSITAILTQKSGNIYTLNIDCVKGLSDIDKINIVNKGERLETAKQNETRWLLEITNSSNFINEMVIEIVTPSGDIFKYSRKDSNKYVDLWDIKVENKYAWKWDVVRGPTNIPSWGDYTQRFTSFEFDAITGEVIKGSVETVRWLDVKVGDYIVSGARFYRTVSKHSSGFKYTWFETYIESTEEKKGDNLYGVHFYTNDLNAFDDGIQTYDKDRYYCVVNKDD